MKLSKLWKTIGVFLITACLLSACKTPIPPTIVDRSRPPAQMHGQHVVERGETLHTIAWEYGRDFRKLAAINDIKPPYIIYPDQIIYLSKKKNKSQLLGGSSREKPLITMHNKTYKNGNKKSNLDNIGNWAWPTNGKIITHFDKKSGKNNGIDISGRFGQPVTAAGNGRVVYSGSGLRGYGKLIIIKHSEQFLSAYAHNHKLFVKEGDVIKEGQKIAEMGHSDTRHVKLHFEIRRNGKPVNPLMYLAKR